MRLYLTVMLVLSRCQDASRYALDIPEAGPTTAVPSLGSYALHWPLRPFSLATDLPPDLLIWPECLIPWSFFELLAELGFTYGLISIKF